MLQADPAQNLRDQFLSAVSRSQHDQDAYLRTWRTIIAHDWYQQQLEEIASAVLRNRTPSLQSEDIQQEAILLLARTLKRHPDLRYDSALSRDLFPHWMRQIIFRDCRQAVRQLMRTNRDVPLRETWVDDHRFHKTSRIDWGLQLETLASKERFVITQYLAGCTLTETAEQLNVSIATVHRRFQRAINALQQDIA